jgi:ribosomal protein L33
MALITEEYCSKCEKVTHHSYLQCSECRARDYREKAAAWNAKTIDERLSDLRIRIEKLEQGLGKF